MYDLNLIDGQVEVYTKNHHFVSLHAHHNGEYNEARKDHKDYEEDEGRDEQPLVQFITSIEGRLVEAMDLVLSDWGQISQCIIDDEKDGLDSLVTISRFGCFGTRKKVLVNNRKLWG